MRFRGALLSRTRLLARECALPALAAALFATAGCSPALPPADSATTGALHAGALHLPLDPTVRGARLVPLSVSEDVGLGIEPGGLVRSIAAGVRVVSVPGGAVVASADRLPGSKWNVTPLPERLGGGFLFTIDDRVVWRVDRWLGQARPLYAPPANVSRVVPGLDRVYVLAGTWHAIDGATGKTLPLGPWPASPTVTAYAAADGWRALAIGDLRGALATFDAGATWRPLHVPIEPRDVSVSGDTLEVKGIEPGHGEVAYDVRSGGQLTRVADAPRSIPSASDTIPSEPPGPLGANALAAAVEDGWPLDDGTALVAHDGSLSRVRLEDGAVVETVARAYPLRPSRCHPIPLGDPGHIGFVCGEARGATVLYSFDARRGAMVEARRFDAPRAILSSGNGAIAVRGTCDGHGTGDSDPDAHHYCIRSRAGAWREIRVEGGSSGERVTVLGDGRFAIVSPPQGNLEAARLTIVEGDHARSVPIVFPRVTEDALRVLDVGVWLDGFEERRPGVLGGWIEAAGTMLGVEVTLEGNARVGPFVRDEGLPVVSGRYGFGWTATHVGFETTDGGMTWTSIDVPQAIRPPRDVLSRACGPVGCSAAGWLRIGWGGSQGEAPPPIPSPRPVQPRSYLSLALDCEGGDPARSASEGASASPFGAVHVAAGKDDRLLTYDATDLLEGSSRIGATARVYAWGPKSADWDLAAKWSVHWLGPFNGATEQRASAPAALPQVLLDVSRPGVGMGMGMGLPFFRLVVSDDPGRALLVARRGARSEAVLFELTADRAPVEIKRADGEPFGEIDAALRVGERWYLSTPPVAAASARADAIVWQVEGATARELARIPRLGSLVGARPPPGRLAVRSDGHALGFVVYGQPPPDWSGPTRWVATIDLDTGAVGDVESLGLSELGDRRAIPACTSEDVGWLLDSPASFRASVSREGATLGDLHGGFARLRVGTTHACVERLAGTLDADVTDRGPHHTSTAATMARASITVVTGLGKDRRILRCGVR